MAEVNHNGPTIEVGIDMDRVQQDADKMQTTLVGAVKAIDAHVQAMQKNFSDAMSEISALPDKMASGMADVLRARDDAKQQKIDDERTKEDERRRVIDFEKKRQNQAKVLLDQNKKIVASFRNMALAAGTVVTAGMGIREMLNFTNDLARMDLAIKSFGMNAEKFFQVRNLMREGGIQDGETFAMADTMSSAFITARERGGTGLLNENQKIALNWLSRYSNNIDPTTARNEDGSRMNFAQWQKEIMLSTSKFYHDKNINLSKEVRVKTAAGIIGEVKAAQYIAQLTPEEINREDAKAKREAESLQRNIENNKKVQELKTSLETNVVDLLAKMSPEIMAIIDSINKFADNPENVKLLAQGLRDLGNVLLQLLKKALNAMEWMGIKTPDSLKKLVGEDPNAKPSIEMSKDRRVEIEKALNVKVEKSLDNYIPLIGSKSLIVTDKDGNVISINSDTESIESIRNRLLQKAKERAPYLEKKQREKQAGGGISELLFPSAHAETISYHPSSNARGSGGKVNSDKVKEAYDILTKKDQYGTFTGEQAKGIIANLMGESSKGLNHQAVGDGGKAYGVAQWHPDRQGNFKRLFGHDMRQGTFAEQIQFLKWEMQNTEKAAGDKVRRSINANEATIASVKYYERPKDITGQSIERMKNIASVNRALQQSYVPRPNFQQMQAQTQVQKVINSRTANSGDSNYNVNIHVNNGNPQQIAQAFEQKINEISKRNKSSIGFMKANSLNGWSGIS